MDKLVNDEAQAWRVTFAPKPPKGAVALAVVREPVDAVALAMSIDVASVFAGSGDDHDGLDIVWLPPNARGSLEIEKRADAWSATPDRSAQPLIRASLRSTRVIWTNTRAVIATAADQLTDSIDAVVRFTATERALRAVEQSTAEAWTEADRLRDLTIAATRKPIGFRRRLVALTGRATRTRSAHLRLEVAVEQLDPALTTASKRLYAELALQANLHDRVEMREGPIEFINDHCELANTRLIEARESTRTLLIAVLLIAQLLVEVAYFALLR
jgi:hypothetical protein